MITPSETLARPLAARVANLTDPPPVADTGVVNEGVLRSASHAMQAGHTHYTDRPGILPLREWAVNVLGERFGVELSPAEATITCGVTEARFVALKLLAKAGSYVIVPGERSDIAPAAALLGLQLAPNPDQPEAISILLLTSQDDPSATHPLLDLARQHGWWIVYEIRPGAAKTPHPAQDPALAGRTISIGEIDPALLGWRVGWMAGSQMANKLRAFKQSMTICTTSISQWAALGLVAADQAANPNDESGKA